MYKLHKSGQFKGGDIPCVHDDKKAGQNFEGDGLVKSWYVLILVYLPAIQATRPPSGGE
jgi:hypothetical protein